MTCEPTKTPDDIDIAALREKYRQERDKRIRPEGQRQYLEAADEFAGAYESDPHSPPIVRSPISQDVNVLVLGGGFCGLIVSAHLKKAGVTDVRIIEQAGDFGGVWYWNRYPGIQCDNDAYCYMPLLEELNYMPTKKFADGSEIYEYCRSIGRHFGLYEGAIFGTLVRSLSWDDTIKRWRVGTNRGDDIRARFVVMAQGPFNRPKLPGIPGIRNFKGHMFHTARWDYAYTGGAPKNPVLDKLSGKRVAIIGTGATGIQAIPYLGRYAEHLYVFQRTPSSVDARGNTPTDPEWVKTLKPGWQKQRQRNFHAAAVEGLGPGQPDLICDFWTEVSRNIAAKLEAQGWPQLSIAELVELREIEDYRVMERVRRRIDSIVKDPITAEALKPYYRFLCKRPTSNDDYLQTFNRPNVTLIDCSATKGVERITEHGIVSCGVEHRLDCIVFASGFEITTDLDRRLAIAPFAGRDGLSLYDHWANGYKTLHGMTSHGFPNQFFTGFTQSGFSANITSMFEQQGEHIAYIIRETLARGAATVEPSLEAQEDWCRVIRETAIDMTSFQRECTPGYYNNEGEEKIRSHLGEPYGPGFYAFDQVLDGWRSRGDMAGLVLKS